MLKLLLKRLNKFFEEYEFFMHKPYIIEDKDAGQLIIKIDDLKLDIDRIYRENNDSFISDPKIIQKDNTFVIYPNKDWIIAPDAYIVCDRCGTPIQTLSKIFDYWIDNRDKRIKNSTELGLPSDQMKLLCTNEKCRAEIRIFVRI